MQNPLKIIAFLWLAALGAHAAPLTIGDQSFEGNALTLGGWNNNLGPEWLETGGPSAGNGFEEYISGFSADGTDHLGTQPGHDVWQDLGVTYQADTRYTLTIAAGNRSGSTQAGNQTTFALADSTGATYASAFIDASGIPGGSFADAPDLIFDSSSNPLAIGKTIRVLLQARGAGRSHFDDIRLDAIPLEPPGTATVQNNSATGITTSSATLHGTVTGIGDGAPTITIFYGDEDGGLVPGNWDQSISLPGTHTGAFSVNIGGLNPATLYFYSARATNAGGDSWALPASSFETLALPATVENVAASGLGATSATVGANVTDNGGDNPVVTIYYGPTDQGTNAGAWDASISMGTVSGIDTVQLSGLTQGTGYFFRAFASNSGGNSWAPASSNFTTQLVTPASVENRSPSGVTGSTATLRGEVIDDGNDSPAITIFYGISDGGATTDWDSSINLGTDSGNFTGFVGGLIPETTYYYTARATNAAGTTWALPSEVFTTTAAIPNAVVINEIHFDPDDETSPEEFIELHNPGDTPIDVSNWQITDAVTYTIPPGTSIGVGGYLVIAQDPARILSLYGVTALGPWVGRLSNDGEEIDLRDSFGKLQDQVSYGVGFPWPTGARGDGGSAELINPTLDNNLGGSWRTSGAPTNPPTPVTYVPAASPDWHYRKGTSEASNPVEDWRQTSFVENFTWLTGQAPIGYEDDVGPAPNTNLDDMRNGYWSVYFRHEFTIDPLEIPSQVLLRIYVDDGCVVWLNGNEVWRPHAPAGQLAFDDSANNHEAVWEELLIPAAANFLNGGTNVLAIHALNSSLNSSDFSLDAELRTPTAVVGNGLPTPGAVNSTTTSDIPPQIRQVDHDPKEPTSTDDVLISAKITDPDGVGPVSLEYQVVSPGSYIRLTDAAYNTGWTTLPMVDDGSAGDLVSGDFVYSALLPASVQQHRRLIRYRITFEDAIGNQATVPYPDDEQSNFAYFVYDGLPSWSGSFTPGGTVETFPSTLMDDLPVYHLIANGTDVTNSQYSSGSKGVHMSGTIVYDGVVYDHIEFENRGEASTYVSGKNKWRFHFNRARSIEARDDWGKKYKSPWNKMNFDGCSSPWAAVNRGMAGLDEAISYRLYELAGVPSPRTNYLHFRVIDNSVETNPTNQYEGDLWGLYLAVEHPDGSFLNDRDLPDGNVYKIQGGNGDKKEQGADQPADSSDWTNFYSFSNSTQNAGLWEARMNMENYYSFRAVNRINGNVDLRTGYNHYFYHHPDDRWWVMPWDLDMMFISELHQGGTIRQRNSLNNTAIALELSNRCREMLDLMCDDASPAGGQIGQLIDEYADIVNPPGLALTWADLDAFMWNYHPRTPGNGSASGQSSHRGNFYRTPYQDSRIGGGYTRNLTSSDHEGFVQFLLDYTTDTYTGGSWAPGNGVTDGYGYEYLKFEADDTAIPNKPTLSYIGTGGFPVDDLRFQSGAFSDPQGSGTFGAIKWRIAEIAAPGLSGYVAGKPRTYEVEPLWESAELTTFNDTIQIPAGVTRPGRTYRVRVRHEDSSGRWSHWSTAVQFTAGLPDIAVWEDNLMITEVMYNPVGPTGAESLVTLDNDDFEYIELKNISNSITLNLADVSFTNGIDFDFGTSTITSLAPGELVLVVKNIAAFEARYGTGLPVAGEYSNDNLANGGETVVLSYAGTVDLKNFTYDDLAPWPAAADGNGPSLSLIDPDSAPDHALPESWTASAESNGTPGSESLGCEILDDWKSTHFSPAELLDDSISGNTSDPDGDGMNNLMEYALDLDPLVHDSASGVSAGTVNDGGLDYLALTFRRRICREHVSYTPEIGTDLVAWNSGPVHTLELAPPNDNLDGTETVTIRSLVPYAAQNREFMRLEIVYTGP